MKTFHPILPSTLLVAVAWSGSSYAATLQVCASGPNQSYKTIGSAVAAAAAGDEIDICPALYAEQLVITQPLTLRGVDANGIERVLLQPAKMTNAGGLMAQAVITVLNTSGVVIDGLAIDASKNGLSGCGVTVSGIHFYNSSGGISRNAIFGAQLSEPKSCSPVFPGNGFGVLVDNGGGQPAPFSVTIDGNSIHDFNRDGILVNGDGITANITGNSISGVGPVNGYFQFGVFIANKAVAHVALNTITQANCGAIDPTSCINVRSEGVVLRAVGDGTVVNSNFIADAQSGIFINGGNAAQITNNVIMSIDALDGINIQGTAAGAFTNSTIRGNTISHVFPIGPTSSANEAGCGINEASGTGVAHNTITGNTINDAYCGVAYVSGDNPFSGAYFNTLYSTLNVDLYAAQGSFPPAVEP